MSKFLSPRYYGSKVRNLVHNYSEYGIVKTGDATKVDKSLHLFSQKGAMFIHIPKCAGVSLYQTLFGVDSFGHWTMRQYYNAYGEARFKSLYKFTIVREPYSRLHSAYYYLKAGGRGKELDLSYQQVLADCQSMAEFVHDWLPQPDILKMQHFVPQSEFICDAKNNVLVDDIFTMENLTPLLPTIQQKCPNLLSSNAAVKLAKTNTKKQHAELDMSPTIMQKVQEIYARDYALLPYEAQLN